MNRPTLHKSSGCAFFRRSRRLQRLTISLLAPGLMTCLSPVRANPHGGSVVHGDIHIGAGTGGNLQIHQNSANAIIHWESFSIAAGELTRFHQPGTGSAVLNRITGGDPSAIHGALQANGNVFVINPNGILVGPSGSIDVHGLVLSTLDVSNGEFLAGGDQVFQGASDKGVTNLGRINAIGGDVFLIGKTVTNSGSITASGRVGLAAGEEVLLTAAENSLGERIFVRATGSGVSGTGITNDGSIEGAAVEMKAHGNIYALAINNKGTVRATGATNSGGRVYLRGIGGGVNNSGSIRATSSGSGNAGRVLIEAAYAKVDGMMRAEGGEVRVSASERVELGGTVDVSSPDSVGGAVVVEGPEIAVGSTAEINASGIEGGSVRIGGGFQGKDAEVANAETLVVESGARIAANGGDGDAGSVILWSDDSTRFSGEIRAEAGGSGRGGFVEVSGKETLHFDGLVSTLAANGQNGTLLLDPTDFQIVGGVAGTNQISNTDLIAQLGLGNVVIATDANGSEDGTITVETGADVLWSTGNSLALLAHGDILFNASVQASGIGGVTAVAGWDGTTGFGGSAGVTQPATVDFADFVANVASYGNVSESASGSIHVGNGSQSSAVVVGSRGGASHFAARGIEITAGNSNGAFSQLGFRSTATAAGATGSIALHVKDGGLTLTAGVGVDDSFAQVGHGGTGATNSAVSGDILVSFATPGDLALAAGGGASGRGNYVQIGHGGNNWDAAKSGSITIDGANDVSLLGGRQDGYAQIGHGGSKDVGGSYGSGVASGAVSVLNTAGKVTVRAGSGGENGYAKIGHGGIVMAGNVSDDIEVHSGVGGILVQGGGGTRSSAQIGGGGYNSDYAISGNVTVLAKGTGTDDGIVIEGGTGTSSAAMIGGGQYLVNNTTVTGSTTVEVENGGLSMTGGSGGFAFVTIGHGNRGDSGNPVGSDMDGTVDVTVRGGDLTLQGGSGNMTSAQIGHGGNAIDGDRSGTITVDVAGGLSVASGSGSSAHAMVGHGGYNFTGDLSGDVLVTALGGAVKVDASAGGLDGYAQIGHGGSLAKGDKGVLGSVVSVTAAGDVEVFSGSRVRTYAMIGHGGYDADAVDTTNGGSVADVTVTAGTSGTGSVRLRGSSLSGATSDHDNAFVQIGNGGLGSSGRHGGNLHVEAADDIELHIGKDSWNYAQIGHGGHQASAASSGLGHSGEITLTTDNGSIILSGSSFDTSTYLNTPAYAQVGHGGSEANGNHEGNITVNAGDRLTFAGGTPDNAYKQLGHGGTRAKGNFSGSISVTARNDIEVTAGTNDATYAQIGHGGLDADGDHTADFINVTSTEGGIRVIGGWVGQYSATADKSTAYAQIGLGGVRTSGAMSAPISVSAYGDVELEAGGGSYNYAQIGNGGHDAAGDKSGVIGVVSTTGSVSLKGAARKGDTYAMIGHGGVGVHGTLQDNITVLAANGLALQGGRREAERSFAQIGHGGLNATGNKSGTIAIDADSDANGSGDLTILGGSAERAYALIGHGGIGSDGFIDGSIHVNVGGNLDIVGGSGALAGLEGNFNFAQIGHSLAGAAGGFNEAGIGFLERDGMIVGEAEFYDVNSNWVVRPEGFYPTNPGQPPVYPDVTFSGSRGGYFLELPDGQPAGDTVLTTGGIQSYALYTFTTGDDGGTYRLYPSATGFSGGSDSLYTDIVEIKDGTVPGGVADWYLFAVGNAGAFSWKTGTAGKEQTTTASGATPEWTLDPNTTYTLRFNPREDGVAFDAWMLVNTSEGAGFDPNAGVTFTHASGVSGTSDIDVTVGGNITLTGGANSDSYATIGHGGSSLLGVNSNLQYGSSTDGANISVVSTGGGILLDGNAAAPQLADAARRYAAIGHHGVNAGFDAYGEVVVRAGAGAVTLQGGNAADSFAQIGHGGTDADGDLAGEIHVVAEGGDLSLAGGADAAAYAMIGHGDGTGNSDGTRQGGIHLFSSGQITATDGGSEAHLFHQSGGDLAAADYLGGDGLQVVANGGLAVSDASLRGVNTMIAGNWNQGPISLAFSNDIDLLVSGVNHAVTTSDEFYLMTGGSIAMGAGYQNAGDGGVFLVAGWNGLGATFNGSVSSDGGDFGDPIIAVGDATFDFSNHANFGHNNGTVTIGNAGQTSGVAVGSRAGLSGVAAYGLTLQASDTTVDSFTQFGFRNDGSGQATGDLDLRLQQGGLSLFAGDAGDGTTTGGSYTQIGHGGTGTSLDGVDAGISISFTEAGEVLLDAGNGLDAYAQIGHGGNNLDQGHAGNITLSNALQVDVQAGRGHHSDARIGHGGYDADGSHNGDIEITAANSIAVAGGFGQRSVGQIGHGGYGDSSGNNSGTISLSTTAGGGGIYLQGGTSTVGSNTASYGQIGHGGYAAAGTMSGDIILDSAGEIIVSEGNRDVNYKLIGHGGYSASAAANGAINLTAAGDIDLIGGSNDYTFAQIGHGGAHSTQNKNAASVGGSVPDGISLTSGGTVRVLGGSQGGRNSDGSRAYAQIGMGGLTSGGPFNGAINVSAQTGVEVSGGGRDHNYARIGHGGDRYSGSGSNTRIGDISVTTATGDIQLAGGAQKEFTSASIGHGGYGLGGTSTGSIHVRADSGKVILTAGGGDDSVQSITTTGEHSYSSAQIGHGVANVISGDLSGDICVVGFSGVEMAARVLSAADVGEGARAQTQIGHGGYHARGNFSGTISVVAPDGSVTLSGGQNSSEGQYSQIGHGGLLADGELRGDITVVAGNGDTALTGGNGTDNYAMIGHGDGAKTSLGQRQGGVHLFSSGQLIGSNGSGSGSEVWIFHQNENGLLPGDYLGGNGYRKFANGGMAMEASALVHESTMISGNMATGLVQIVDNSDTDYVIDNPDLAINTSADFYIVTGGNITMLSSYQNAGTGDVVLVAGWDKTSGTVGPAYVDYGDPVNFCHPVVSSGDFDMDFNNCDAFGNNGKTLTIGSASQTESVAVGSRGGANVFAAYGIAMEAGNSNDAFTQLGFRPTAGSGGASGDILLRVKEGGLQMTGGTGGNDTFVQIGHGGTGAANATLGGNIEIDFCAPGDLVLAGGGGSGRYAQIGHGGTGLSGDISGAVTISGADDITLTGGGTLAYARIGHGGASGSHDISGAPVTVDAASVSLRGGGAQAYAQIGHGGYSMNGSSGNGSATDSAIAVTTTGTTATDGVHLRGGTSTDSYAMIGSGGRDGSFDVLGDVTVTSAGGGISLTGTTTNAFTMIGHGGHIVAGDFSGTTTVSANGGGADDGISLKAGGSSYSFANIGHATNNVTASMTGDTIVNILGGGLTLEASSGTLAVAAIGLQGRDFMGNRSGAVDVTVTSGDVTMTAGTGTASFAQLGHGGWGLTASAGDMGGNVTLTVENGTLTMNGGAASGTNYGKFAMIGHGGGGTYTGAMGGSVIVDVEGAIAMNGGAGLDGFTLIGHGGRGRSGTLGAVGDVVRVTSRSAGLHMAGGEGSRAFSMIGLGGSNASGATSGSVIVDVQDSIEMAAGDGSESFTLIGHGGRSYSGTLGSVDDVVEVVSRTGGLNMINGNGSQAFSMIGMGGSSVSGSKTGNVTVSTVDGVLMDGTAGDGAQAFVQIGHGGYSSGGSLFNGDISVTGSAATSAVTLLGGDGAEAYHYAMIGHGGGASVASGGKNGAITVAAGSGGIILKGGGISTVASTRPNSFAQIGHGGSTSGGAADGAILVSTSNGGDIILHGGGRQYTHAQIGHGGRSSVGSSLQSGTVTVLSDGKVELKGSVYSDTGATSSNSNETFAQIGHGGMFSSTTFDGTITVNARTGVLLESGASTYARAQVGHGGYSAGTSAGANAVMTDAAVTVTTVEGGVILDATQAGGYALAMIGNGGTGVAGTTRTGAFRGDITVDGGTGNIELHSGNRGGSGAMIGNGGASLSGNHSGNISVTADGDLIMDLQTSASNNTFSRIGHGGAGSTNAGADLAMGGNMSGEIHVDVGGKAVLDASGGNHGNNYVQIGHGGGRVTGNFTGNITVLADGGDGIALTGGSGTGAYSQIGHGGVDSVGNKSGAIFVDSGTGGLSLTGGSADKAYALVGHGGVEADGFIDGRIDVAVGGDLAVAGGAGAFSFAQIGHSLAGARGGWGGLIEIGGLIVGEAEWYDEAGNWVVRPEGFYPTNPGGTAPPPATFSGTRNGWFLEVPDGQPAGTYASNSGTYALYTFTTGNEGGTYRLYSHATGFNGNSDSLYMDIVELKDGSGGLADWYFIGTGGSGVFSWNTGNGGHEHTSGTTGPPVWDLDPNTTYTLRINPREDGVSIDSWMLANTSEGALFDPNAAVTFAETNGVGVGSDVNVTVGGNITLAGGAGGESHAVIGHRGDGLDYDLSGNVHVEGQNIALTGGLGSGASAQIGHGGHANANAGGILDGNVHVRSLGDLSLQGGGSADRSNAIIGHGDLGMSGTHSGDVLIRAAGATVLADGSGSGAVLGHAGIDDTTGDTRFALITETLDNSTATLHGLGDTIARMLPNGSVDIGVQQGDLRVGGVGGSSNSSEHVHLFAGGNVIVNSLVQNSGTGAAGLVAGWNGTAGLIESYPAPGGVPEILALGLDIAPIISDDTTWGNNGGAAHIGDGTQTTAAAFGSGGGTTTLFGHAVTVTGSDISPNAYAQIGTLAPTGTSPTGAIRIETGAGGVSLTGGNQVGTHAQIGHRSIGSSSPALSGDIRIASLGGLDLTGGGELLASAQIGHGGVSSTIGSIGGDITLFMTEDIHVTGGSGGGTYAQVGHGGLFTHGDFSGAVAVVSADGDIVMRSSGPGTGTAAYAKIGHGDDLRGALAGQSGTGTRNGDIAVSAGAGLNLENALIGHVYDLSRATATTGETWIGVARTDPTDPAAGDLTANAASEFSGVEGVRFYLPRRANNQIAAGATINGEAFDGGALYEPWPVQRPDEFTNFLTDANGVTTQPGEHNNSLGSGPAPVVAGAYAMYFHEIILGGSFPPPPVDPDAPGGTDDGAGPGGDGSGLVEDPWAYGYASVFPDDRSFDDWLRDQEESVTGWGFFRILYEGFEQYGYYGESTFRHDP